MRRDVAKIKLKYVDEYRDRTGAIRRYFRKGKRRLGTLPGQPGSEEFMAAYAAYLAEQPNAAKRPPQHVDSLAKLITDYYGDPMYTKRSAGTRKVYRSVLDKLGTEHGHRSVKLMTAEHAERIVNRIGADRPAMANLTRAVCRRLFALAIKRKMRPDNPFATVEHFEVGEHHTWSDAELLQFEKRWKIGTRERLAYALLLYTGQRVGDVAKMRRSDLAGGGIEVVQEKTGVALWVPIHPELDRALRAYPAKGLTLIGAANGRPISGRGFSTMMRRIIRLAGLPPRCVPHGLRKANQRLMAENGGTGKEMQSMSGHRTLKETERYTRAADQKRLALEAIRKLKVPNASGGSA